MANPSTLRNMLCTAAAAVLTAAPVFAANISTDYDHNANFRAYHTFSFYKVQTSDPFWETRIQDEVTSDLTKAGYQMVPSGGDLAITVIGNVHSQAEYDTFYNGLGGGGWGWRGWGGWGGWGGGWGQTTTTVNQIPVDKLMMDMYDHNTHQLVWRGRGTENLGKNNDKNANKLAKDIDHMLNGFPPKTKG